MTTTKFRITRLPDEQQERPPETPSNATLPPPQGNHRFYASYEDTQRILETSCAQLGVSTTKLGRILGVTATNIFHYLSGRRRPCAKYMTRLHVVKDLGLAGVPVALIWAIDWNNRLVHWVRGYEPDMKVVKALESYGFKTA